MDEQNLPEQGEIVLATVARIMDHGAYVNLDEYDGTLGFLHISEIAPGWIRSINKFVKQGEKKVLLVKRVNLARSDIDLSLKQVSNDQRKKKLLEVKRFEKSRTFLQSIKEGANLSDKQLDSLEDGLYSRYDSIYAAFMDVARNGTAVLKGMDLSYPILDSLKQVCRKIRIPSVEIRGVLELTSGRPDGVEIIKRTLLGVSGADGGTRVQIAYLGAPKYRVSVTSQDFKSAERALKPVLSRIQKSIETKKGTFRFEREESKKVREG
jgi:translation initiation factor 2 subunit 1